MAFASGRKRKRPQVARIARAVVEKYQVLAIGRELRPLVHPRRDADISNRARRQFFDADAHVAVLIPGEGQPLALRRPPRLDRLVGTGRLLDQVASVHLVSKDAVDAGRVGRKGQALAIGRPADLPRIHRPVRPADDFSLAAVERDEEDPHFLPLCQCSHGQVFAVWRPVHEHIGKLVMRHPLRLARAVGVHAQRVGGEFAFTVGDERDVLAVRRPRDNRVNRLIGRVGRQVARRACGQVVKENVIVLVAGIVLGKGEAIALRRKHGRHFAFRAGGDFLGFAAASQRDEIDLPLTGPVPHDGSRLPVGRDSVAEPRVNARNTDESFDVERFCHRVTFLCADVLFAIQW